MQPDVPHDDLADVLGGARWPQAEPERLARLARHWEHAVREQRVVRRGRMLAAAAAVLVAAATAWLATARRPLEVGAALPAAGTPPAPSIADSPPSPPEYTRPRDPNAYEQVVAASLRRRQRPTYMEDELVRRAIHRVRYDARCNVGDAATPLLGQRRAYFEQRLRDEVRYFDGAHRSAALRLLGVVGRPASADLPLRFVRDEKYAPAAAEALSRLLPAPRYLALTAAAPSDGLQAVMVAALRNRGDDDATAMFLACVAHRQLAAHAMPLVNLVNEAGWQEWLRWLDAKHPQHRAAAARLLSSADDPALTERLVVLTARRPPCPGAWTALAASRDPAARKLVREAEAAPALWFVVQAAKQSLHYVAAPESPL